MNRSDMSTSDTSDEDVIVRLAQLRPAATDENQAGDQTVLADLARGRRARRNRTAVRAGVVTVGVAAAAVVVGVAVASTSSPASRPSANGTPHTSVPPSSPTASTARPSTSSAPAAQPAIDLVAYRGTQRPGFTVRYVPKGYVLQGVSGSTLDIADAGDHSSLDTFSGKLTVGIEASSEIGGLKTYPGQKVQIHGRPGVIATTQGTTILVYEEGRGSGNLVTVQSWSNIKLTQNQVIAFACGVTVTADAERQHG